MLDTAGKKVGRLASEFSEEFVYIINFMLTMNAAMLCSNETAPIVTAMNYKILVGGGLAH
ncbi:hypothetical protein NLX71_21185 [Paenibacillus sp. MZ04-78.2]|uniref:hypothetical protein n=1 Tax=Paenibacillus sp. MZ04-78.2 TaxID=2962034 RepID=UPI0020B88000|nr:hypothetical protein [Paenibacillus sp. MZ04-78.2]MCP3775793.1 hypothetical protein [Paenibacillus sp. MZ04-78.2]